METAILTGKSREELKLLINLAKKLGIGAKFLSREEIEDFGLALAMKQGKTGKTVDTENILRKLKK